MSKSPLFEEVLALIARPICILNYRMPLTNYNQPAHPIRTGSPAKVLASIIKWVPSITTWARTMVTRPPSRVVDSMSGDEKLACSSCSAVLSQRNIDHTRNIKPGNLIRRMLGAPENQDNLTEIRRRMVNFRLDSHSSQLVVRSRL